MMEQGIGKYSGKSLDDVELDMEGKCIFIVSIIVITLKILFHI